MDLIEAGLNEGAGRLALLVLWALMEAMAAFGEMAEPMISESRRVLWFE